MCRAARSLVYYYFNICVHPRRKGLRGCSHDPPLLRRGAVSAVGGVMSGRVRVRRSRSRCSKFCTVDTLTHGGRKKYSVHNSIQVTAEGGLLCTPNTQATL